MLVTTREFIKLIMVFIAIVLTGCGGGGESSSSASPTYTISGTVSGGASSNVTVNLMGANKMATTTDLSGNYSFTGLANGNYTVNPTLAGYMFNPSNTAVTISGANVSGTNFTATANIAPTQSLSGTVTGAVKSNVLIALSGAATATTLTNISGNYSFTGLPNGSYTATPTLTGYNFSPHSENITISGENVTIGDFVAAAVPIPTYSISGTVSGAVLAGVRINFTGASTATSTTDTNGNFTLSGLSNGSYTATPTLAGYTFSPANFAVTVSGANVSSVNFVANASISPTYSLSGTITGSVLQNVLITLSGAGSATTLTNASGNYSFSGLTNGSFAITPSLTGYTFSPSSKTATISGANATASNFVATAVPASTYSIFGAVSGAVTSNVTINLTGATKKSVITDFNGNYRISGLVNGGYTVTPSRTGYTFNPTNTAIDISNANVSGTNFIATAVAATLQSITVSPLNPSIPEGLTQQLTVTGVYSDGTTLDITSTANWSSDTLCAATVSSTGLVTTITGLNKCAILGSLGNTATILVSAGGRSGSTKISVTQPALVDIEVFPSNRTIAVGENIHFSALGHYSNGSTLTFTQPVSWSSYIPDVATVDSSGDVHGWKAGYSIIRATYSGVIGQAHLTVK